MLVLYWKVYVHTFQGPMVTKYLMKINVLSIWSSCAISAPSIAPNKAKWFSLKSLISTLPVEMNTHIYNCPYGWDFISHKVHLCFSQFIWKGYKYNKYGMAL